MVTGCSGWTRTRLAWEQLYDTWFCRAQHGENAELTIKRYMPSCTTVAARLKVDASTWLSMLSDAESSSTSACSEGRIIVFEDILNFFQTVYNG